MSLEQRCTIKRSEMLSRTRLCVFRGWKVDTRTERCSLESHWTKYSSRVAQTLQAIKHQRPPRSASTHALLASAANTARNDQNTADSARCIHANHGPSAAIEMLSATQDISSAHTRAERRHWGPRAREEALGPLESVIRLLLRSSNPQVSAEQHRWQRCVWRGRAYTGQKLSSENQNTHSSNSAVFTNSTITRTSAPSAENDLKSHKSDIKISSDNTKSIIFLLIKLFLSLTNQIQESGYMRNPDLKSVISRTG